MKYLFIFFLLFLITDSLIASPVKAPYLFSENYTIEEIMGNPDRAEEFIKSYLENEGKFFSIARDDKTKLTYDGYNLDKNTGLPLEFRYWSAPSKECLDIAICIKAIEGNDKACLVVSGGDREKARDIALNILKTKLESYWTFYRDNPGYGGFMPWYFIKDKIIPAFDWQGDIPGLDNGEWVWTLLVTEKVLRDNGYVDLADKYLEYINILRKNAVLIFYDKEAGKVRADVHITDMSSYNSSYETIVNKPGRCTYLTGEHGVHEGVMMVMFVTLFGNNLPEEGREKIWKDIKMKRVEHKYGTTWEGYWGSSHESWAYLFLPLREMSEYRQLFRLREIIRTQNAVEQGYPGLASSAGKPGEDGYLDGAGIEGVGSQMIRNNNIFALYGAFPLLLEFSGREKEKNNYSFAWLLNMLKGRKMEGPFGAGEGGYNDGSDVAYVKTIDGSFSNIVALCGGLEKETGDMLKYYGKYDLFIEIMTDEYNETFGEEPLKEPVDFVLPCNNIPVDKISDYVTE